MKLDIHPQGRKIIVLREEGEPRYRSESAFWYALRSALRAQGKDVIKKRMTDDGHMVSEGVYYVRERKQPGLMIWDDSYQIRAVHHDFNTGQVTLDYDKG